MQPKYPNVRSEEETLAKVLSGASIARYGDGEFKIAAGHGCVSQIPDKQLTSDLREILVSRNAPNCIVGIPRLDARSPKIENWSKYKDIYPKFLAHDKDYYSAFISRPDSAPWIYTADFYNKIASLWREQSVVLVSGSDRSLTPEFLYTQGARFVFHVECARRDAYKQIDQLMDDVLGTNISRVILCCGPTATVMAHRLSMRRRHAIDLGHIGMFWYNDNGEKPKWMRSRSEKNLDSGGQSTSKETSSTTT